MTDQLFTSGPPTLVDLSFQDMQEITFIFNREDVYFPHCGPLIRAKRTTKKGNLGLLLSGYEPTLRRYVVWIHKNIEYINILKALRGGPLELIDTRTNEIVPIEVHDEPKSLRLPHTKYHRPPCQVDMHFTRDVKNEIWRDYLQLGVTYHLRFSRDKGSSSARHALLDKAVASYNIGLYKNYDPTSVTRPNTSLTIHVRDDPPPPRLTGSIKSSTDYCYIPNCDPKAEPHPFPFPFTLTVTNPTSRPITLALVGAFPNASHLLDSLYTPKTEGLWGPFHFVDKMTGEELEDWSGEEAFCSSIFTNDSVYWEFRELRPGESFETNVEMRDELYHFTAGHTYTMEVGKYSFSISHWRWGEKTDFLDKAFNGKFVGGDKVPAFWKEFGGRKGMNGTVYIDWDPSIIEFKAKRKAKKEAGAEGPKGLESSMEGLSL